MARIGLTSTGDRNGPLSCIATEHDLEPVSLPCIEVIPADGDVLAMVRADAAAADWILITSSRAVRFVWPDGGMPPVPVAAVGTPTSQAVIEAGGEVAIVGEGGAVELLARLERGVAGLNVMFPHASGADPATARRLARAGANVCSTTVYETRPIEPADDHVDAVLFGSPSAIAGWCLARELEGLTVGAIGETTRAELLRRGHDGAIVPPRPDFGVLIALVADDVRATDSV